MNRDETRIFLGRWFDAEAVTIAFCPTAKSSAVCAVQDDWFARSVFSPNCGMTSCVSTRCQAHGAAAFCIRRVPMSSYLNFIILP